MDLSIELEFLNKFPKAEYIAAVDEVGRGCLFGPVVAGAVLFKRSDIFSSILVNHEIDEIINDSKKLSAKKRELVYMQAKTAVIFSVAEVSAKVIDQINILEATKKAILLAISALSISPDLVLVDGNMKFSDTGIFSIIKGDQKSKTIALASIIAKETRDKMIKEAGQKFPEYAFETNVGYGTQAHIAAIKKYGLIEGGHRMSFLRKYQV